VARPDDALARGTVLATVGTVLTPALVGVLASCGWPSVRVLRRPQVALLALGDELVSLDQAPGPGQIFGSNTYALDALLTTMAGVDLQRLLDAVIFNYLIGNYDAHGKNFSIVYNTETVAGYEAKLSPLYDLVCTVYYPDLSKKMAMKIGGEYLSDRISPRHFETLADEAGLAKPFVKQRVPELATSVIEGLKTMEINQPVAVEVAKIIQQRSEEAISQFAK